MASFKVILKRRVLIVERTELTVEADDLEAAGEAALAIESDPQRSVELHWAEGDVSEAEIDGAEVDRVVPTAYGEDDTRLEAEELEAVSS